MTQAIPKLVTFEEFIAWYPENSERRYELHDGVIVEMPLPKGKHERVVGFLASQITNVFLRLKLPYFLPKTVIVRPLNNQSGYSPGREFIGDPKQPTILVCCLDQGEYRVKKFRGGERVVSPTFPELNLTAQQIFDADRSDA